MEGMIIAESNPATEVLDRLAQAQTARKQARAKEQLSAITSRIESVSVNDLLHQINCKMCYLTFIESRLFIVVISNTCSYNLYQTLVYYRYYMVVNKKTHTKKML